GRTRANGPSSAAAWRNCWRRFALAVCGLAIAFSTTDLRRDIGWELEPIEKSFPSAEHPLISPFSNGQHGTSSSNSQSQRPELMCDHSVVSAEFAQPVTEDLPRPSFLEPERSNAPSTTITEELQQL